MSVGAWLMLVGTWSVVIGISSYLFWKVLTRPRVGSDGDPGEPGDGPP